jgi:hypothetical protein
MVASMGSQLQINWHATFTWIDGDLNTIGERRGDRTVWALPSNYVPFGFLENLSETAQGAVRCGILGRQLSLKDPSVFRARGYTRLAAIKPNKPHRTGNDRIACSYSSASQIPMDRHCPRGERGVQFPPPQSVGLLSLTRQKCDERAAILPV